MVVKPLTKKHISYLYSSENIRKLKRHSFKLKRILNNETKKITPSLGYIVGVLLGDGYLNKRYISLHVTDIEFATFFARQFQSWCGVLPPIYRYKNCFEVKIGFTDACTFLKNLISDLSWVDNCNIETKKMIIRGLWDSEGSINNSFIDFHVVNYEVAFIFKKLCDEIVIKNTFHKYGKFYFVRIFSRYDKTKFLNEIGVTISRKREKILHQISKQLVYKGLVDNESLFMNQDLEIIEEKMEE